MGFTLSDSDLELLMSSGKTKASLGEAAKSRIVAYLSYVMVSNFEFAEYAGRLLKYRREHCLPRTLELLALERMDLVVEQGLAQLTWEELLLLATSEFALRTMSNEVRGGERGSVWDIYIDAYNEDLCQRGLGLSDQDLTDATHRVFEKLVR